MKCTLGIYFTERGFIMRRPHRGRPIGALIVCAGLLIILTLVLPSGFWWFFLGIALIVIGILILRC
jgi:hypothetical protein